MLAAFPKPYPLHLHSARHETVSLKPLIMKRDHLITKARLLPLSLTSEQASAHPVTNTRVIATNQSMNQPSPPTPRHIDIKKNSIKDSLNVKKRKGDEKNERTVK